MLRFNERLIYFSLRSYVCTSITMHDIEGIYSCNPYSTQSARAIPTMTPMIAVILLFNAGVLATNDRSRNLIHTADHFNLSRVRLTSELLTSTVKLLP